MSASILRTSINKVPALRTLLTCASGSLLGLLSAVACAQGENITLADASLSAAFYADSSCLLTVDSLAQTGKTIIDADVDDAGSRMLIHCDTEEGRRLTLLARGDALNVAQRVPLLSRAQIQEGEFGMIAWLTRTGVNYADDSAPRRYVVGGNVILRKSPPADVAGYALHTQRQSFAQLSGTLEPLLSYGFGIPYKVSPEETDLTNENSLESNSADPDSTSPIESEESEQETRSQSDTSAAPDSNQ